MRPGRDRDIGWALALALGTGDGPRAPDWPEVWSVARGERIATLAWLKSGNRIRRHAPAEIAAAWRRHALAAEAHARRQLHDLGMALDAMERDGIAPIVLKGLPLSVQLHGEPFARVSTDIDLFVALHERERARRALTGCGWSLRSGRPPWDETFERDRGDRRAFLEMHSMLVHDTHAHVPLEALHTETVLVAGRPMRALASPALPVHLATHAAIHEAPSMLWLIDFAAAWRRASGAERTAARELAHEARLDRHLAWALDMVEALHAASAGDATAVRALGFLEDGSRRDRPLLRAVRLASGPLDAARVAGAWIWPRFTRDDLPATAELVRRRIGRLFGSSAELGGRCAIESVDALAGAPRAIALERDVFLPLLREAIAGGGAMWVRVRGASMAPAIPVGATVHLCPLAARSLREGDVVLAVLPSGLPVMHRIRRIAGTSIVLQGDALASADPPVTGADVIAVAERLRVAGRELPIPARGPRPWRRVGAHWYRRVIGHPSTT